MFENINGWKAQSALGGALAGWDASTQVRDNQQQYDIRDLIHQMRQHEFGQQKEDENSGLNALVRGNKISAAKEEQQAHSDGSMADLKRSGRESETEGNRSKVIATKLDRAAKLLEWHQMADQYLDSLPPDQQVDGWHHIASTGRDLGVKLPDQLDENTRMRIKAQAQAAQNNLPHVRNMASQAAAHVQQMSLARFNQSATDTRHSQDLATKVSEGKLERESRERIAAEATSRATAVAEIREREGGRPPTWNQALGKALEAVQEGRANPIQQEMVATEYRLKELNMRLKSLDTQMLQLQAGSRDKVRAEQAKAQLEQQIDQTTSRMQQLVSQQGGAGRAPAPQSAAPEAPVGGDGSLTDAAPKAPDAILKALKGKDFKYHPDGTVELKSPDDAKGLPKGTRIKIGNRTGTVK